MGPAFVKRRMQAELGRDWEKRFASFDKTPSSGGLAWPGPSRDRPRRKRARLRAISGHAVGGGSRPLAAWRAPCAAAPLQPGVRHHRDRQGAWRTAPRGARLPARGAAHAAPKPRSGEEPLVDVQSVDELSTRRLLTMTWLEGKPLLSFLDHSLEDRNRDRDGPVPGVVGSFRQPRDHPRRPASRPLHGLRGGARQGREALSRRYQPARLRLHPHLQPDLRRRGGRPLPRFPHERPRPDRARLSALGLQRPHRRDHRRARHCGTDLCTRRFSTTGCEPSPTASSRRNMGGARCGRSKHQHLLGEADRRPARIRADGPCRNRARLGDAASRPN